MTDPRIQQLAHNLITFSCHIQPGEKVLIEGIEVHAITTLQEAMSLMLLPPVEAAAVLEKDAALQSGTQPQG